MMHDMRDLQCLNVGITPGCYSAAAGAQTAGGAPTCAYPGVRSQLAALRREDCRCVREEDEKIKRKIEIKVL